MNETLYKEFTVDACPLPLDVAHSPWYVAELDQDILSFERKLDGCALYQIKGKNPEYNNIKDSAFDNVGLFIDSDGTLNIENRSKFELLLAQNAKHFCICLPSTFFDINAITRGQINQSNTSAANVLKLVNTIDYLLSKDGISNTWSGYLAGETVPEQYWNKYNDQGGTLKGAEKHKDYKIANRNIVELPKYLDPELKKYFMEKYSDGTRDISLEQYNIPLPKPKPKRRRRNNNNEDDDLEREDDDDEEEELVSLSKRLIIEPKISRLKPEEIGFSVETEDEENPLNFPKARVLLEFIPLSEATNVSIGFQDNEYLKRFVEEEAGCDTIDECFRNEHMINTSAELGCIVLHYIILDPRVDLMRGFERLYENKLKIECKKQENRTEAEQKEKQRLRQGEFDCSHFAISPEQYRTVMSSLLNVELDNIRHKSLLFLTNDIFKSYHLGGVLDITKLLSVYGNNQTNQLIPFSWKNFNFAYYLGLDSESEVLKNLTREGAQLKFNEHIHDCITGYSEFDRSSKPLRMYCFSVPNRVVHLHHNYFHPIVLNYSFFPFYNTNTQMNQDNYITYKGQDVINPPFDFVKRNLMLPALDKKSLQDLQTRIEKIKVEKRRSPDIEIKRRMFLPDYLRLSKFKAPLEFPIEFKISEIPILKMKDVKNLLIQDMQSKKPRFPDSVVAILKSLKDKQRQNQNFSLFVDVYDTLDFQYFEDLSCHSNYLANIYHILDSRYAILHAHRYIELLMLLAVSATRMEFGDQFYVIFYGTPESKKSFALEFLTHQFLIKDSWAREGESTEASLTSENLRSVARFIYLDDADLKQKIFSKNGNEQETSGTLKTALTTGTTSKTRSKYNPETGKWETDTTAGDLRRTTVMLTNLNPDNISDANATRVMIYQIIDPKRDMDATSLTSRINDEINDIDLTTFKDNFNEHQHNFQIFCCLINMFVRSGAIPFTKLINATMDGFNPFIERLKNALRYVVSNKISVSNRLINGKLIPLSIFFMMQRVWAHICSGSFNYDENSLLRPGAKFSFDFIDELVQRHLLIVTMEDCIKAVSYFNRELSGEVENDFLRYIRKKTKDETKNNLSIDYLKYNMRLEADGSMRYLNGTMRNPEFAAMGHNEYSKYFFLEYIDTDDNLFSQTYDNRREYTKNFNWLILHEETGVHIKEDDVMNNYIKKIHKEVFPHLTRHQVADLIDSLQSNAIELLESSNILKSKPIEVAEGPDLRYDIWLEQELYTTPVLKLVKGFKVVNKRSVPVYSILLRTSKLANFVENVSLDNVAIIEKKDLLLEKCNELDEELNGFKFKGQVMGKALKYISFKHIMPTKLVLPGCVLDSSLNKKIIGPCPQIMQTLTLTSNPSFGEDSDNQTAEEIDNTCFNLTNCGITNRIKVSADSYYVASGEYDESVDFFCTHVYFSTLQKLMCSTGWINKDMKLITTPSEVNSELRRIKDSGEYIKNCPSGLENSFNEKRNQSNTIKNYIECMLNYEKHSVEMHSKMPSNPKTSSQLLRLEEQTREEEDQISSPPGKNRILKELAELDTYTEDDRQVEENYPDICEEEELAPEVEDYLYRQRKRQKLENRLERFNNIQSNKRSRISREEEEE